MMMYLSRITAIPVALEQQLSNDGQVVAGLLLPDSQKA